MRRLLRREAEPEEFSRPSEFVCSVCSGEMLFKVVPCPDETHGDACSQVHFGYECRYCNRVVSEEEAGPDASVMGEAEKAPSTLRSGDWRGE